MFCVYVLRSLKDNKRYIGYTGKPSKNRLWEHNTGKCKWTKLHKPFELVYKEEYKNKTEARKREIFLKSGQDRKSLGEILK